MTGQLLLLPLLLLLLDLTQDCCQLGGICVCVCSLSLCGFCGSPAGPALPPSGPPVSGVVGPPPASRSSPPLRVIPSPPSQDALA